MRLCHEFALLSDSCTCLQCGALRTLYTQVSAGSATHFARPLMQAPLVQKLLLRLIKCLNTGTKRFTEQLDAGGSTCCCKFSKLHLQAAAAVLSAGTPPWMVTGFPEPPGGENHAAGTDVTRNYVGIRATAMHTNVTFQGPGEHWCAVSTR
jgi:hypothetical protein